MSSELNIAIVNTMAFPSGAASVNRILSYSKGLVEADSKVTVYSTSFGEDTDFHEINGIRYKTLREKSNSGLTSKFSLLLALFRLMRILLSSKNKHSAIILVSNSLLLIYPIYIVSRIKRIKLIQEKSEFPFVLNKKSAISKIFAWLYVNTTYKLFDGMIIMTHKLEEYFTDKVRKNCKMIVIPMTVEPERFLIKTENSSEKYIAYCGDIGGNKDGVLNLITSFSLIEKKYPDLKLILIGGSKNPNERVKLEEYAQQLNCKNVVFYGVVSRDEIPPLLCNAHILSLARPSSLQSTGGFPTKLGEYLSTGKPVVVTKVGDIPLYLTDQFNAFVVEPDNVEEFAEKLEYVLNNYEDALLVANRGKELVETTFNYRYQSSRIKHFFENII